MKKVISIILATAMVLTMMSAFAIDPVENVGFDVESYTVYSEDFNTEATTPFSGTDLDIATKPTRWEYVEVEEGNSAVKVTYKIPSFEEVLATLPEKPANEEEIEEGVTYKEDYTEEAYNATYGATKSGYLAVTSDNDTAFSADAEAYVLSFDICFPSIPEYGASVNFWNVLKQGGGRKVQNAMMTYQDTFDENGELVEKGETFGFNLGGELFPIEAETWYNCTQVIDIANRYVHYYINGEKFVTVDVAAGGALTDRAYLRVVYSTKGMEYGFMLDNIHAYEAQAEAPVEEIPFQYCVSGPALDFEGYTIDDSIKDAEGAPVTQIDQTIGLSSADKMSIVADPEDANNTVMKWDNTNGDATADIYLNMGTASKYAIKDKANNAIVFDYDVYVEDAETLDKMQPFWFTAYTPVRAVNQIMMGKSTKADCATISYGGKSAIFAEKEWHNVKLVYEMGTNVMTLYLDDVAFYDGSLENGPLYEQVKNPETGKMENTDKVLQETGFRNLDYLRIQMGKTAKGVLYFDNLHIYEASNTACAISAPDFVAGVSKVGDVIALEASSYVAGEAAVIQMSTDGKTWSDFSGIAATLTNESVYYRVKAGDKVSDVITLYGVAGEKLDVKARIYDFIDFETKDGVSYGITENEKGFDVLHKTDGTTVTPVKNGETGAFSLETKVVTTNSETTGSYRTTELATAPSGYANADGIGDVALKIVGNGEKATGAPSQLYIALCGKGNSYPGGADSTNSGVDEGDIYVAEFDYAIDALPDAEIVIGGGRAKYNSASTAYFTLFLGTDGVIKCQSVKSKKVLAPKTWYKIKIVAHYATGKVETYVDGELIDSQASNTGSLGQWESFRLYGDRVSPATNDVVYYDNFNFYIAQAQVAPTASDVKLGTITYKNGDDVVDQMGAYDKLNITATLTNNGVADSVVCVFALYDSNGILKALSVKPVVFVLNEAKKTVNGEFDAVAEATDKAKVFLWENRGGIAPKGAITADNAELVK